MEIGSWIGIILYLLIQLGLVILAESSAQSYLTSPKPARALDCPIYILPSVKVKKVVTEPAWIGSGYPRLATSFRRLLP